MALSEFELIARYFDSQDFALPEAEGVLLGIKGQYLIFDAGVINMRKYGGYELSLSRI